MGKKKAKKGGLFSPKLLAVLALVGIAAYYFYNEAQKVIVSGGYFRIHKLQGTSLDVRVFLQLLNEGNARIDVQSFIGQFLYKGSSLGVVTLFKPGQVPPLGQTELEFKALISLTSVGMQIYEILKAGKASVNPEDFTIKGTRKAEGFNIPINEKLISA